MNAPAAPATHPALVRPADFARGLGFAAVYFAAAMFGLEFRTEPERMALFWPPNGLLLGTLLVAGARGRWTALVAGTAASLIANFVGCNSPAVGLGFTLVNVGEPWFAAWLLRYARSGSFELVSGDDVFRLFFTVLATGLVSAVPGAAVIVFGLGVPDFAGALVAFWLSDVIGVVVVTPFVLAWARFDRVTLPPPSIWCAGELVALYGGLAALAVAVFTEPAGGRYVLSFAFPLFVFFPWAALRFRVRGASAAVVVIALLAIWNTGRGRGPFVDPSAARAAQLFMAQLFVGVLALCSLVLAATQVSRDRSDARLRDSEERYRQVTETIQEVFWAMTPDCARVLYVSPQYEMVWGRTCASLYAEPDTLVAAVHPDDRAGVAGRLAWYDGEFRIVRPDGAVRWVHTRSFPVRDEYGVPWRVVGISRDVTDVKDAEQARTVLIEQLQKALAEIKTLRGMIPMCAWCRKVRDDAGFWDSVEGYISEHTHASVTHGICPKCLDDMVQRFPDLAAAGDEGAAG
ncbi:MASE1 domain-containing protein [Gemmata sp. JC717]|uniref:MASE1 domain-containing protein n=1 Tax=Gemmata algarum TaxID=2975278 RepID=UPI0021BB1B09|nr:MASE1 domain-containing protein [Gemmata algarum]MDY3551231.1 MASE1 domain-containing protein [Gemmata algarum]